MIELCFVALLVHFWADYVFQTDWMALNKHKNNAACLAHVIVYTACFLLITQSWQALAVIGGTHYLIDRYQLTKYVTYWKNRLFNKGGYPPFGFCDTTGYYDNSPYNTKPLQYFSGRRVEDKYGSPRLFHITITLYIVIDNLFHITINYLALKYL